MNKYIIINIDGYVEGSIESTNLIACGDYISITDIAIAANKKWNRLLSRWEDDDRALPPLQRNIIKIDFVELFTDTEMEDLIDFARTNSKAALFLRKLDSYDLIDLNNTKLQTAITAMETVGIIGTGRANEIINSTSDKITEYQPTRQ